MSKVAEIEQAIAQLPPEQWLEIRRWMDLHPPQASAASTVDWSASRAATRPRLSEAQLPAATVMEALATVRE